jgi:hypothetical protein
MPRVPSAYSAGGGVGVGKCRFGGGSFILCCPFCIVDATSRNTFVGSDMKGFVGSDRNINASASATVTSSYFLHLLGGASSWNQTSPTSRSSFFESDDDGILNVVTLLEASSRNFFQEKIGHARQCLCR